MVKAHFPSGTNYQLFKHWVEDNRVDLNFQIDDLIDTVELEDIDLISDDELKNELVDLGAVFSS